MRILALIAAAAAMLLLGIAACEAGAMPDIPARDDSTAVDSTAAPVVPLGRVTWTGLKAAPEWTEVPHD